MKIINIHFALAILSLMVSSCYTINDNETSVLKWKTIDKNKSFKDNLLNYGGEPTKKYIGENLDSCYLYQHTHSYEEICFRDTDKLKSIHKGPGIYNGSNYYERYTKCLDINHDSTDPFNYIESIDKAFRLVPIDKMPGTIRFYYKPSFSNEIVFDIHTISKSPIVIYKTTNKSIWNDLYKYTIVNGDTISGRIVTNKEYLPSISIKKDSITSDTIISDVINKIKTFGLDTMKCISNGNLYEDGNELEIHSNTNRTINKIKFQSMRYKDERYSYFADTLLKIIVNNGSLKQD